MLSGGPSGGSKLLGIHCHISSSPAQPLPSTSMAQMSHRLSPTVRCSSTLQTQRTHIRLCSQAPLQRSLSQQQVPLSVILRQPISQVKPLVSSWMNISFRFLRRWAISTLLTLQPLSLLSPLQVHLLSLSQRVPQWQWGCIPQESIPLAQGSTTFLWLMALLYPLGSSILAWLTWWSLLLGVKAEYST